MTRATAVSLLVLAAVCAWGQDDPDSFTDGRITVLVQKDDGQPPKAAEVQLVPRLDGTPRVDSLKESEVRPIDAEGRAVFEGLGAGNYFIRVVSSEGGAWGNDYLNRERKQVEQTLKLKAYRSLSGVARNAQGDPVSGLVLVADRSLPLWTTCEEGRFHVDNFDPEAVRELALVDPGYSWQNLENYREEEHLEVLIPRGTVIEGILAYPDGQPAAGVTLYYRGSAPAQTDAQGKFRTWPLPPGEEVMVYGWHNLDGKKYKAELRTVLAEEPVQSEIVDLKPFLETGVRGKVVRKDTGEPVRARILVDQSGEFAFPDEKGRTDANGVFELKDLPPQRLWLTAMPIDPTLYAVEGVIAVDLSGGQPVGDVTFTVDQGCAVRGVVLDAAGNPTPAVIYVSPSLPGNRPFQANEKGRFVMSNLPIADAEITLSVGAEGTKETKIKVGPISKGQTLSDVEIRLSPQGPEGLIRGKVVDRDGKPLSRVEIIPKPFEGLGAPITDEAGAFEQPFRETGEHRFEVYVVQQAGPQDDRRRIMQKFKFVEGETITVEAGKTYDHRIVLDVEPLRSLMGQVTDEAGAPLQPEVYALATNGVEKYGDLNRNGWFLLQDLPEGPFLVEVTAPGYQAKVLESGRDFRLNDMNLHLTLKPGPFPENVPVLQTVTGRAPEDLANGLAGVDLKHRENRYVELARSSPPEQPVSAQAKPAPEAGQLRVTDAQGQPVKRIYVEQAQSFDYQPQQSPEMLRPAGAKQLMDSPDGLYTPAPEWSQGVFISTEGTGAVFVQAGAGPVDVVLQPASTVTIRVEDYEGKSVADVPVGPAGMGMNGNLQVGGLPKTNSAGVVTFERLPPGFRAYSAYERKTDPSNWPNRGYIPTAGVNVQPRQSHEATLRYGTPAPGTPDALFDEWWKSLTADRPNNDPEPARPPKPEGETRQKLAERLSQILNGLGGSAQYESRHAGVAARMAEGMGLEETVPALENLLKRWKLDLSAVVVRDEATMAMTSALAALAGNRAVGTLKAVASDGSLPYYPRRDAVIALGQIGTDEAVAAFKHLRDAAYGKPGAPERQESYTHAERMAEAATMVFNVIPGTGGTGPQEAYPASAWVSEDMTTGKITIGRFAESTELHMKRFGDEWLVVEIGQSMAA